MSTVALVSFRTSALAWADAAEDQRLFRRVTTAVLVTTTVACIALLLSPAPKPDQSKPQALPAPMAKMLLEHKPEPIPVEAKLQPEPQPDATPAQAQAKNSKPEPVKADPNRRPARADEPKSAAVLDAREPVDNKPVVSEVDTARRRVASLGLLAAKDDIAQVRGSNVAVQVKTDIRQGSGVGGGAASGGGAEPGSLARSMITANGGSGSGGNYTVTTGTGNRAINSGGLAGRTTTRVDDPGIRSANSNAEAGGTVKRGNSGKASRSIEEIRLVFARNKGAIDAIYQRALREDPTLQGRVLVEVKIAPTGEVLACRVVSSEVHSPELEAKLAARVRQFDFGAKDVDQMIINFPLDLLPS